LIVDKHVHRFREGFPALEVRLRGAHGLFRGEQGQVGVERGDTDIERVSEASAAARFCAARAASTLAPRYPKSSGSQENNNPLALPQALRFEGDAGTGPVIGAITSSGSSIR